MRKQRWKKMICKYIGIYFRQHTRNGPFTNHDHCQPPSAILGRRNDENRRTRQKRMRKNISLEARNKRLDVLNLFFLISIIRFFYFVWSLRWLRLPIAHCRYWQRKLMCVLLKLISFFAYFVTHNVYRWKITRCTGEIMHEQRRCDKPTNFLTLMTAIEKAVVLMLISTCPAYCASIRRKEEHWKLSRKHDERWICRLTLI